LLAIESQAFVKWRLHFKATKRFLSPDPSSANVNAEHDGRPAPHFYYATTSAHLSQSDFGLLFPWLVKKVFATEEPERIMRLNVRAILQLLRERGIPVAATSAADMELGGPEESITDEDTKILGLNEEVRGWNFLSTDVTDLSDVDFEADSKVDVDAEPGEAVVAGELMKGQESAGNRLEGSTT